MYIQPLQSEIWTYGSCGPTNRTREHMSMSYEQLAYSKLIEAQKRLDTETSALK